MLQVTINGHARQVPEGATVLRALRDAAIEIPTLCHDDRLQPCGACRLCIVSVAGGNHPVTACNTPAAEGMDILTHTPELEDTRRTLFRLLAAGHPVEPLEPGPDNDFRHWLRRYQIPPAAGSVGPPRRIAAFRDDSHPYIHVDMAQCITCYRCVRICEELQGQFVWRAWHRGADTRILTETGGPLLESACVSCGACTDTCPTGALADKTLLKHGPPETWTRTTCPYCGTGCEMNVGTRNGHITHIRPVPDAPVSKGHLCVKGRYSFDFARSSERVTEPLIREGGAWRTVSWEEATACAADRLTRIIARHGPDSVGMLGSARGTNEENYLAQKFARLVLGTNNVDCCARVCHAPTAAGMKLTLGTGAATNSFDDIEKAAAFLVCGCNPTENHPIVGARIKQAVLRGARLIVIDPREIELTQYATLHLQLRPGTNVPLLHGIAHVLVTEELCDPAALAGRVAGFEEFRAFISGWTPERAGAVTGVPALKIREAARLYALSSPAMCFHGLGVTEHVQGTGGVMCLVNLALLTGNVGRPGSGVNPLRGQNNVQGSAHMGCEPGNLTGYVPLEQARDAFEAAWQAPLPASPGLNLMQMIDAAGNGQLHALWAIGYDVAFTNPNAGLTRAALGNLDLVIVQDLFMNELARNFGHIFFPACSSYEKDGTFMNSERRVQRVRKVMEPLGNSRPDWEVLCDVANAMGDRSHFAFGSAAGIWEEIRRVWKAGSGISYARLEHGGLQWPCPDEDHPGTAVLHEEGFPQGKRAPLQCIPFTATTETTTAEFPFLLTTGRTLYQFNAGTMTMRTPNRLLRGVDTLDIAPADARRLGLQDGDLVKVRSRHGETVMPLRVSSAVQAGDLFATFHTTEVALNQLTGPHRDTHTMTPEYKVVAASVEKADLNRTISP